MNNLLPFQIEQARAKGLNGLADGLTAVLRAELASETAPSLRQTPDFVDLRPSRHGAEPPMAANAVPSPFARPALVGPFQFEAGSTPSL